MLRGEKRHHDRSYAATCRVFLRRTVALRPNSPKYTFNHSAVLPKIYLKVRKPLS